MSDIRSKKRDEDLDDLEDDDFSDEDEDLEDDDFSDEDEDLEGDDFSVEDDDEDGFSVEDEDSDEHDDMVVNKSMDHLDNDDELEDVFLKNKNKTNQKAMLKENNQDDNDIFNKKNKHNLPASSWGQKVEAANMVVTCQVGVINMTFAKLLELKSGDALVIGDLPSLVDLKVNDVKVAEGVLVELNGRLGVKIIARTK